MNVTSTTCKQEVVEYEVKQNGYSVFEVFSSFGEINNATTLWPRHIQWEQ